METDYMKRFFFYVFTLLAMTFCFAASPSQKAFAQTASTTRQNTTAAPSSSNQAAQVDVNKIVAAFTAKETEFRRALNEYAFKRDAVIQVIGMGGQIAGEYHRVSHFTFDNSGNRFEKIVFFPMPTYPGVTAEDIEDMSGVNPFALEASKLHRYNFTYVGKERIDELNLYILDVAPKVIPDPKTGERLFVGRIWVDDRDLQIVKSRGKGVPQTKTNKFPVVETYREQIEGRYWFPTYSYADEELVFDNGQVLHIRLRIKYTDFVKGRVDVKITEVDDLGSEAPSAPEQKGAPQQQQPAVSPAAPAQSTPPSKTPITGGVLNDKALEMPKPSYPEAARQAGISGVVRVRVTIDEEGKVIAAEATDGPKELREAAEAAALQARFEPVRLHGQRIKVNGVLTYRFDK
jgi:TonB family protein